MRPARELSKPNLLVFEVVFRPVEDFLPEVERYSDPSIFINRKLGGVPTRPFFSRYRGHGLAAGPDPACNSAGQWELNGIQTRRFFSRGIVAVGLSSGPIRPVAV